MHDSNRQTHDHPEHKLSGLDKLRKMAEYWVSHNEEHAASYQLWAKRAHEAGQMESAAILEELAEEMTAHNKKLRRIAALTNPASRPD